ncbi:HNH endonuclease [Falsiroseomonas oryzae]|uniref:HNH endonuclease n=1 Tax=Falsiroseomonas oryzae TaxID=2766473 RepID=UPI0022EAF70F|nr:HNH endonuclease [Roseomonas sp. MO-31]
MASDHKRFPPHIQRQALARQKDVCACCGVRIHAIGEAGVDRHPFGERAEGHHVIPHRSPMNGPISVENCVVICRACHLSVHQGGHWRDVSIYNDILHLPMPRRIARIAALYPHYRG